MALGNEGSAGASMSAPITFGQQPDPFHPDPGPRQPNYPGPSPGLDPRGWAPRPGVQRYLDLLDAYHAMGLNHHMLNEFAAYGLSPEQARALTRGARTGIMPTGGSRLTQAENFFAPELSQLGNWYGDLRDARGDVRAARQGMRAGTSDREDFQNAIEMRNKYRGLIRRGKIVR